MDIQHRVECDCETPDELVPYIRGKQVWSNTPYLMYLFNFKYEYNGNASYTETGVL